ncbi:MAG: LptF/LptG family permease [Bacteroidia bacterium]|nr:LptF/LptG family permease [Bacteroidia bacterium]
MKLLDWYLIRQYLAAFFFMIVVVLTLALVVDYVEKVDDFIEKKPPLEDIIFVYYANFLPYWGNLLMPVCIFLAVIFFTGRLAGRSELIPILAGGVSFYRILVPYIAVSLLLALASGYLKSYLVPKSTAARLEFEYLYFKKRRISSTKDIHKKVATDTYLYIGYYNEKQQEGTNITLEKVINGDLVYKLSAKRMDWVDSLQHWRLRQCQERTFAPASHVESIRFRDKVDTTFLLAPDDIYIKEQKAESMTLPELLAYIRLEEMRGSDILKELYIERHRRFSDPIAIVILTLIGFAMASRKRRGGVALYIGLGLLLCFLYIALLFAGQALIGDTFPAGLAVWMPNLIFLPISIFLLWRAPK